MHLYICMYACVWLICVFSTRSGSSACSDLRAKRHCALNILVRVICFALSTI